jgi:predicted chitinase
MYFTAEQIADATGAPLANVQMYWPGIVAALDEQGIDCQWAEIAVIATIATEVSAFEPINEYGSKEYFTQMYENRQDLGNNQQGDGARFHGRGFIQLTGRYNYRTYGDLLGISLVDDPDLALDPVASARILALYFARHDIQGQALQKDWVAVRKSVNGGTNGWDRFISVVNKLIKISGAADS